MWWACWTRIGDAGYHTDTSSMNCLHRNGFSPNRNERHTTLNTLHDTARSTLVGGGSPAER